MPLTLDNIWIIMILKTLLPSLGVGFVITAFTTKLYERFHILNNEDMDHLKDEKEILLDKQLGNMV